MREISRSSLEMSYARLRRISDTDLRIEGLPEIIYQLEDGSWQVPSEDPAAQKLAELVRDSELSCSIPIGVPNLVLDLVELLNARKVNRRAYDLILNDRAHEAASLLGVEGAEEWGNITIVVLLQLKKFFKILKEVLNA